MPKGPGNRRMGGTKEKVSLGTVKRLLKIIFSHYKFRLLVVFVCIIISSIAGVKGLSFLKTLIDGYIEPLLGESHPDFAELDKQLFILLHSRRIVKVFAKFRRVVKNLLLI